MTKCNVHLVVCEASTSCSNFVKAVRQGYKKAVVQYGIVRFYGFEIILIINVKEISCNQRVNHEAYIFGSFMLQVVAQQP